MDALDRRLVAALKQNARSSVAELATRLAVSRGTIGNRMRRLEADGTIAGYTLQLREQADSPEVRAWVSIAINGHRTRAVVQALLAEPDVDAVHDTNGRWDLLAEIRTSDLAALSHILERLRSLPAISTTETSIHLETYRTG